MENDIAQGGPEDAPSAAEARARLAAMDTDASQLAARLVTPWWYHPILGGMVAAAIIAQSLPSVASMSMIVMVIIWIPFLIKAYTSRYKVWMSEPAGPRSRRMMLLLLGTLVVLMASGVLMKIAGLSPWWVLVPAVLGFVATVWLGRRYDAVLRSEISTPSHHSTQR
ncbi:MAG: hypothetical protein ACTMII_09750 [Brachybacterium sp.]|uniref:hypothetical protein n=1 Tax=unclassified Brachybacterium TaxID=2623841 RepID=UPI003F8DA25E